MPRVILNHCKTRIDYGPGRTSFNVGELIEREEWYTDFLPRKGELITVHPKGTMGDESWTGVVTGIQHVFTLGKPALPVLTVRDERITE